MLLIITLQFQKIDGVVSVVNGEPVFYSELVEMAMLSGKVWDSLNTSQKDSILEILLAQKYIVSLARKDSNITVSDEELKTFSENYKQQIIMSLGRAEFLKIASLNDTVLLKDTLRKLGFDKEINFKDENFANEVAIFLGRKLFEEELKKYRITEEEFLSESAEFIKSQILLQKYISAYIMPNINITEDSIRRTFQRIRDSFPKQPKLYFVQQIVIPVIPSFEAEEEAYWKAREIYRKLKKGERFEKLARIYSEDTISAKKGGDLGYISKDILKQIFPPENYLKIVNTPVGGITPPLRGPSGYNVMKIVSKKKDSIRIKNILIKVKPRKQDILKAKKEALRVRKLAMKDFEGIAQKYSVLKQQINLGYIALENVPETEKDLRNFLKNAKEGDVSQPIYKEGAFIILHVKEIIPEKRVNYEDVKEQIRAMLLNSAIQSQVLEIFKKDRDEAIVINYFNPYK